MSAVEQLRELAAWLGLGADDTLRLSHGRGLTARSCNIDPVAIAGFGRADVAAFVRGVHAVLNEPPRSTASTWDFAEAARCILPTLERTAWADGVVAAGGSAPFSLPFGGELRIYFVLELDAGYHALTEAQVSRWGATGDRVERAAASMLFHRTREAAPEPWPDADGVEMLRLGDGFDAARANILDACDYALCRAGVYFALPAPDRLLLTRRTDVEGLARLRRATEAAYATARLPLSTDVFAWRQGRRISDPVP